MVSVQDPRRRKVLEIIQSPDYTPEEAADLIFATVLEPKPKLDGTKHPKFQAYINRRTFNRDRILKCMRQANRALTVAEIATAIEGPDHSYLRRAVMSRAVLRLVAKGLLVRHPAADRSLYAGVIKGNPPSRFEVAE
jgi:hypothetical protein